MLYVDEDPVITSAGTAAGDRPVPALSREEHGPEVANAIARRMVVPPHRDGGQAQYVERPVPRRVRPRRRPARLDGAHLDEEVTVDELARRAHMSAAHVRPPVPGRDRHHPAPLAVRQRVLLAQRLLEATDLDVERSPAGAGFGGAATLRHHFVGRVGTSPQRYRRTFRRAA